MEHPVSRTPPPLKWLAEKRARILNALNNAERLHGLMTERHAKWSRRAAAARVKAERASVRLANLQRDLASLDRTIAVFDSAIDPTGIQPVNAFKDRYGRLGIMRASLVAALQASPEGRTTDELAYAVQAACKLEFDAAPERARWMANSFKPQLKRLVNEGLVERLHSPKTSYVGRWVWKRTDVLTLADLRAAARTSTTSTTPPP